MKEESTHSGQTANEPTPQGLSVLVNPDQPTIESVVFVHGWTGHPERTWSHKGDAANSCHGRGDDDDERPSKFRKCFPSTPSSPWRNRVRKEVYWPRDLLPSTLPNARILTFGYDTNIRHRVGPPVSKSTVYDIAWDFLIALEAIRRAVPSRPLLFVAHSLGGIVVKECLRRSRGCEEHQIHNHAIYESTCGIIFFGTPHSGADPLGLVLHIVEAVGSVLGFSVNKAVLDSLLPSSERLRELRDEFGPMARQKSWIIYSFQEQYGLKGLNAKKVVDDAASCLNDPGIEVTQHIASNHMNMCRFSRPDDVEYQKVIAAITRVLESIPKPTPTHVRSSLGAEARQRYLDLLKFDQIDARYVTIRVAQAKTCEWFLHKSEYQDWRDIEKVSEHHGFLWIKGKPGTGKSTLMKFALANAKKTMKNTTVIAFFFNARGDDLEKTLEGMYRSLLYQLLVALPHLESVFDSPGLSVGNCLESNPWNVEQVKNLFGSAIERLGKHQLTCFIDALDECDEDQVRDMVEFFEHLGQLAVSSQTRFCVCFSSRHYPHISIDKSIGLILEDQDGHQQDIDLYLHSKLKAGRGKLMEKIKTEIRERASGIFLWVVLVVQLLNKEYDRGRIHALRKRLNQIPNGLDELFRDILTRDNDNTGELILCIQWVLFTQRPLRCEELYFAILAGVDPDQLGPWDPDEISKENMQKFILNASKGLVEETKSKNSTVQFIHESVRDYLLKGNGLDMFQYELPRNFQGLSHERLKHCCQQYLKVDVPSHVPMPTPLPDASSSEAGVLRGTVSRKFPFLEYAVRHVLYHADRAASNGTSQGVFVEHFPLQEWINLSNLIQKFQVRRHTSDASLLYILAENGLPHLIQIELKRVPHMDIVGQRYRFPLLAAVANRNREAAESLLRPHHDDHSTDDKPYNHSLYATDKDREDALDLLFRSFPDISASLEFARQRKTFFMWAVDISDASLPKVLFATKKIDIGQKVLPSLILWAIQERNETLLQAFLEGPEYIYPGDRYAFALRTAWSKGCAHIVEQILAMCPKDYTWDHALCEAAANGQIPLIAVLNNGANINFQDGFFGTALQAASVRGNMDVVKFLLEKGADVNLYDGKHGTALRVATDRGHTDVVKLLLEKGADTNLQGEEHWTALQAASSRGDTDVVKLLLEKGADVNLFGGKYGTALQAASAGGHISVVDLLLEEGADVNLQGGHYGTALRAARSCSCAAKVLRKQNLIP